MCMHAADMCPMESWFGNHKHFTGMIEMLSLGNSFLYGVLASMEMFSWAALC